MWVQACVCVCVAQPVLSALADKHKARLQKSARVQGGAHCSVLPVSKCKQSIENCRMTTVAYTVTCSVSSCTLGNGEYKMQMKTSEGNGKMFNYIIGNTLFKGYLRGDFITHVSEILMPIKVSKRCFMK